MTIEKKTNLIIKAIKSVCLNNNEKYPISLHEPNFKNSNSLKYLKDCIETGWVSSSGEFVKRFEQKICEYTKAKYCVAVASGTVALRLGLHIIGVCQNDEVLIPPMSFVATANAVSHLGAFPHFIDIDEETLGICPNSLNRRLEEVGEFKKGNLINKFTGRRISAIIPVHIFGNPAKIFALKSIAKKWGIPIIEDAAEALGSWTLDKDKKVHCGLIGEMGAISFNGNKIITTGGGGAIITNNKIYADNARHLSTTAKINHNWEFYHDMIGWNDRMPNINAALGVAQMEKLTSFIENKRIIHRKYISAFSKIENCEILNLDNQESNNNWLITLVFKNKNTEEANKEVYDLLKKSHEIGILIRPVWNLLNCLPMYKNNQKSPLNIAENLSKRIVNLPSSSFL